MVEEPDRETPDRRPRSASALSISPGPSRWTGADRTLRASAPGRIAAVACLLLGISLVTCDSRSPVDSQPEQLAAGTWGGDNAGVIIDEITAHVHVGCTYGDFPAPIALDDEGRFSIAGDYLLRAFPVAVGPTMPAQFAGVLHGQELTLTVAVNDTVNRKLVVLGPVSVTFKREPRLGPCPICSARPSV